MPRKPAAPEPNLKVIPSLPASGRADESRLINAAVSFCQQSCLKQMVRRELKQKLSHTDITVPLRSKDRIKKHTERYAIAYLLSALGQTELE
jgi:hypothetical protein